MPEHISLEQRNWTCRKFQCSHCDLCSSTGFSSLAMENGFKVVKCSGCGVIYVKPMPSEQELKEFYAQYISPEVSGRWQKATTELFVRDVSKINSLMPPGRLLDIGCGFGFFLQKMKESGWDVAGCEPSPVGCAYASEQLGIDQVQCSPFLEAGFEKESFDLVTAWYVFHHLPRPGMALKKIFKILKPGGMLIMRVPNINLFSLLWKIKLLDCGPVRYMIRQIRKETSNEKEPFNVMDPPVHLYAYSPLSLSQTIQRFGFQPLRVDNDGMLTRGGMINRVIDSSITRAADLLKWASKDRLDYSISFSLLAKKPG